MGFLMVTSLVEPIEQGDVKSMLEEIRQIAAQPIGRKVILSEKVSFVWLIRIRTG